MIVIVIIIIPLLSIFLKLFSGPGETWQHITETVLIEYTVNSIWLIIGCTIISLFLGVTSAWIVSRYKIPFQNTIEWMLILPLAIPSYITAYAYAGIFDYGGTLELLSKSLGFSIVKIDIMNIFGLIFVLSFSLFPYVYVSARAVFLFQSNRLIDASKVLGASELKTFFKIALPIARPAIVGGVFLVLMEVLNDYGAAYYYGVSTFTTGIFRTWFSLQEPKTAIYLSAILLLFVFILIYLERLQRGKKSYANNSKSTFKLAKLPIKKSEKYLLFGFVSLPIILGFILPVLQLIYWSLLTYSDVLNTSFLTTSLQSLLIAVLTAVITVFFALMILYFPKWNNSKLLKNSSKIAILGYAIPGAVIALGVMVTTIVFDKWLINTMTKLFNLNISLLLNGTLIILVYAYLIRFIAVGFNPIEASQLKINKNLSESSKLLGKNNLMSFFKIELPLLKTGIFSALILVFVDVMKELPLTLILKPYNINTLAVKAYEYASDEQVMEASIPSLFIIATGILPIILLNKIILKR